MAFSLKTLLYFFALLAAALAVFGVWGVLAAIGILALRGLATRFWDYRVQVVQWGIVTTAVAMVILRPVAPFGPRPRVDMGKYWRIREIGSSLLFLHHQASLEEKTTTSLPHSWRSYVWDFERDNPAYFDFVGPGIDLTKPWQLAADSIVLSQNPFATLDHYNTARVTTDLFAVVDSRTVWQSSGRFDLSTVSDALEQTILIVEAGGYDIQFTEPQDFDFEQGVDILTRPLRVEPGASHIRRMGYFYHDAPFRHCVTCDGVVHRLYQPLPRDVAIAALTARGGEVIDLAPYTTYAWRLHWQRIWSLVALAGLAIVPARWLRSPISRDLK